ncbi:chromate transporter, partial [Pyxidicoccus fallax]|nr:chromate transporter [Pyxidicoccus fallax]
LVDAWTVGLAGVSAVLLIRFRVNSAWLVLGGGVAGMLLAGGLGMT